MAYVKPVFAEKCRVCKAVATLVVCNYWNAPIAFFCGRHERQADEFKAEMTASELRSEHVAHKGSDR